jgi:hypothetical protein
MRKPSAARSSIAAFSDAMAKANRCRIILKKRYGHTDQQLQALVDVAIPNEHAANERAEIRHLGEIIRVAKRKKQNRETPNADRSNL